MGALMQEFIHSEDIEKLISVAKQDILEKFGITFPLVEDGKARGELTLRPEHRNHYGIPFGGIVFNLADNTCGMAFLSAGGNGVTVSGSVNFLRGADPKAEKLICEAEVRKTGKHLFFIDAEISDDFGTVLSEYSFVFTNLT